MQTLGFGQPMNGVVQMAYIVPDIYAAVDRWTDDLQAGPWYLLENLTVEEEIYRGQPCNSLAHVAMGFAGHLQIELIQPLGETPGIHRETVLSRGYGFHHYGVASADVHADAAQFVRRGHSVVYQARVPTGGTVVYLERPDDRSGFVELIPVNATLDAVFTQMWRSSCGWDGRDRMRLFASAVEAAGL